MKLQANATTAAFPAALVAASIALAVLLLPAAAVPAHSSGVAPALELVAGEVVAAVRAPAQAVARAHHPGHVAVASAGPGAIPAAAQPHAASTPERAVTAPHARAGDRHARRPHAVARKPPPTTLEPPALLPPAAAPARGRGKALGHLKQLERGAGAHGKARGRWADAPHGPPGQAKKASEPDRHAGPHGHGGAR